MYATVDDIEARWRPLSTADQTRAAALISDATVMIDSLVTIDDTTLDRANVVCCNMVIRAMSASQSDSFGLSQSSMTAGPYTQSWSYANPSGDMYMTKMEKRMLGITQGYVRSIRPKIGCCHD